MSDSDDAPTQPAAAVRRPRPPHRRATAARGRRASSSESPVSFNWFSCEGYEDESNLHSSCCPSTCNNDNEHPMKIFDFCINL